MKSGIYDRFLSLIPFNSIACPCMINFILIFYIFDILYILFGKLYYCNIISDYITNILIFIYILFKFHTSIYLIHYMSNKYINNNNNIILLLHTIRYIILYICLLYQLYDNYIFWININQLLDSSSSSSSSNNINIDICGRGYSIQHIRYGLINLLLHTAICIGMIIIYTSEIWNIVINPSSILKSSSSSILPTTTTTIAITSSSSHSNNNIIYDLYIYIYLHIIKFKKYIRKRINLLYLSYCRSKRSSLSSSDNNSNTNNNHNNKLIDIHDDNENINDIDLEENKISTLQM